MPEVAMNSTSRSWEKLLMHSRRTPPSIQVLNFPAPDIAYAPDALIAEMQLSVRIALCLPYGSSPCRRAPAMWPSRLVPPVNPKPKRALLLVGPPSAEAISQEKNMKSGLIDRQEMSIVLPITSVEGRSFWPSSICIQASAGAHGLKWVTRPPALPAVAPRIRPSQTLPGV